MPDQNKMSNHQTPEQNRIHSFQLAVLRRIALALVLLCFAFLLMAFFSGCAIRFPIGEDAKYGTIIAGYEPPVNLSEWVQSPTLRDK